MSYSPNNPNGQAAAANSAPVTLSNENVQDMYIVGQSAQSAIINNIIPATAGANATDLTGYRSFSIQVVSTATSGSYIFEASNDNVNFQLQLVVASTTFSGQIVTAAITASSSSIIYTAPVTARYLRLRVVSTLSGGSVQAFTKASQTPWSTVSTVIAQNQSANLSAAVSTVNNGNSGFPAQIADVGSAAITTTTTSGPFTPTYGNNFQYEINVTAVSGTTPTMDAVVYESRDAGTNYVPIYSFPRITAAGSYTSPVLPTTGNRVEVIQTVGGTTPSFTRSINRMQSSASSAHFIRQIFDRTVTLTTASSTTTAVIAEGSCNSGVTMTINIGTATTAPALQIQGSDDNGATWYMLGTPLTAVASSSVSTTVSNVAAQQYRAIVTTAGSVVVAGYVMLRAF